MARTSGRSLLVNQQGFSLLEMLMVVAIMATVVGMTALVSPAFVRQQKAESGIAQVLAIVRNAHETALTQRRNVQIRFIGDDVIQTVRENIPNGTTVLRTIQLENGVKFFRAPDVPDTPDHFATGPPAQTGAVAFGASGTRAFTSEGTLIDANGDVLNGTLFLAIPDSNHPDGPQSNSERAISIFGMTSFVRAWRWDGSKWVE